MSRIVQVPAAASATPGWQTFSQLLDVGTKAVGLLVAVVGLSGALTAHGPEQLLFSLALSLGLAVLAWRLWPKAAAGASDTPLATIRGLLPFNETDGERFFGRDTERRTLLVTLNNADSRVCLVVGDPSCGKTSLLRAGLIPALKDTGFLPVYVADYSADVVHDVGRAVAAAGNFQPDQLPLVDIVRRCADETHLTLVVACDQFERLFLSEAPADSQSQLVQAVNECLDADLRVRFVFCSRSGVDAGLQQLEHDLHDPVPLQSHITVARFSRERAEELLDEMARSDGVGFSAGLRSAIVGDLLHDRTVCPAELQSVSMWVVARGIVSRAGYEGVGRARGLFLDHVRTVVESVDHMTSVDAAQHLLLALADRALRPGAQAATKDEIVGDVASRGNVTLERDALDRALDALLVDGLVIQVLGTGFRLIHDYFARDVVAALGGPTPRTLRMWWRARQMATGYGLPSAAAVLVLLVAGVMVARFLGTPGAQPIWGLTGYSAPLTVGALTAFDASDAHLAIDDGDRVLIWHFDPERRLAWEMPPVLPGQTIEHPSKSAATPQGVLLPVSLGFLTDNPQEAYEVFLDVPDNRWQVNQVHLADSVQVPPLQGDLSPTGHVACPPAAAAYSRALSIVAIAYRCGTIDLLDAGGGTPRSVPADDDPTCQPAQIALNGSEQHLAAAYDCLDATQHHQARLRTWDLAETPPRPVNSDPVVVPFPPSARSIASVMYQSTGRVTVGFSTGANYSLWDVSAPTPYVLMLTSGGNEADPQFLWVSANGQVVAEEQSTLATPRVQVREVGLWLGPFLIPSQIDGSQPPLPPVNV